MKVRDSGMPDADYWETIFDVPLILRRMRIDSVVGHVLEVGCGYGTFTIPVARAIQGKVFAYDIEPEMIRTTMDRAALAGASNIIGSLRDLIADGADVSRDTMDYVMLFNILHHDQPLEILAETRRILRRGGLVGCVHWNYDPNTPRGPSMDIRPQPEQVRNWIIGAGFQEVNGLIDLPPYHYGWLGVK